MQLSESEKNSVRAAFSESTSLGLVGRLMVVIWFVVSVFIAGIFSDYVLLVSHYGFARVLRDRIHFVSSRRLSKDDDLVLSNGDRLGYFERDGMAPILFIVLLGSFLIGYAVIRHCSKRMKRAQLERMLNDA